VEEFAESLSLLEDIILLDIYPAREAPIEGVTSEIIFDRITSKEKLICSKNDLPGLLKKKPVEVLVTFGAGDIDRLVPEIEKLLRDRYLSKV
jgi:UDP-N-acetylmuramate--alanine ligase